MKSYAHTSQTLRIFWQHAWRYKWRVVFLFVGIVIAEGFQAYTPIVYRDLFNVLANPDKASVVNQATWLIVFVFILNFDRIGIWRIHNFVNNYFQPRVMADLTQSCYEYIQNHSTSFFSSSFVGSLVTKIKRYERSFEVIADQLYYDLGRSILDTALLLVVLFIEYPVFGWVVLAWCVVFLIFSYWFSLYKLPVDIARANSDTKTTAQLADSITNNINIKLFTSFNFENRRFKNVVDEQFKLRKRSWDLATWGDVIQSLSMILLEFGVMYYAITLWQKNLLQVGDLVLLQSILFRMFDKLWNTGKNIRSVYEALADGNEMTEMLLHPHEVQDTNNAKTLKVKNGHIAFSNVGFTYNNIGKPVFNDFNLTVEAGERLALVGPSGGGKSTVIKLLLRFIDIQKGVITVDDQDISKVTQDSLRDAISLVPQEPILFHRSLMENIRYGDPKATEEEVVKAAKLAHAHEFISKLPDGYNTFVGERGIKLSGGERQRVAIARAILKNAPILALDEATSSLDSESEMLIQDALKHLMKDRTVIVIAHRLSTIMQMDRIVVIEKGRIKESGSHGELLELKDGTYQKLWGIQVGGFEERK